MVTGMALGALTKLANFSLKNPKTVLSIAGVVAIVGFGVHYKLLVGERDKLRVATAGYEQAVDAFKRREATLREDLRLEREAAAIAVAARDEARRTLEAFRTGREGDPEALEWARQSIPVGELTRLCEALPEMEGC